MKVWRGALLAAVGGLLIGACTIEQDLSPRVDALGEQGRQDGDPSEGPSDDPSPDPSDDPTDAPTDEPSDDPSDEPSDEPSEQVSPDPDNTPPVARADDASTAEDTAVTIAVLANDEDADGDPLTVRVQSAPGRGVATVDGDRIRYTPDDDVTGTDRFTYAASDGRGGTSTASVAVTIRPVNDSPQAIDDRVTTPEDTSVTVDAVANDIDVDGDELSLVSVGTPSSGTARIVSGRVVYDPDANATGADSFSYTIQDPDGATDRGTITVDVGGRNDAPIGRNDSATTDEDRAVTIDVLANDSDPDGDAVSIASVGKPGDGTTSVSGGQVVYTPSSNFNGSDSFTYTVKDPSGATDTATVSVTVRAVNDPPTAVDDTFTVDEDSSQLLDPRTNDDDPEDDALTVTSVGPAENGVATVEAGRIRYEPVANYNGADQFTYTVSDGDRSDTATVSITVSPVNDRPVAGNDSVAVDDCRDAVLQVLDNDSDPADGDSLTIVAVTQPTSGRLQIGTGGTTLTWLSDGSRYGSYSATYTVDDGSGTATSTDSATVKLAVNGCPIATNDDVYTYDHRSVTFNVFTGAYSWGGNTGPADSDPDGTFSLAGYTNPRTGTLTSLERVRGYGPGWFTWDPPSSYGSTSFTYTIRDDDGATDTATVTLHDNLG